MSTHQVMQVSCNAKGCNLIVYIDELAPGRARDKLRRFGWSSAWHKADRIDLCSKCTARVAELRAKAKAEKEAKKAEKEAKKAKEKSK